MPKGIKGFQKGHPCFSSGRTHFKKGMVPWNKGRNIACNENFIKDNPMKKPEIQKMVGALLKGKSHKHTDSSRKKLSLNRSGKPASIHKGQTYEEVFGKEKARHIKEKQSIALAGIPKSQEHISKIKEARAKQVTPVKDTLIEVKIQNFLKSLGIEFFTHQRMIIEHGYQCDILIPSMNMVIECDGNYWHKYPTGREIDHIRTSELLQKGFKVLRLWEFEIKGMDLNAFQERIK